MGEYVEFLETYPLHKRFKGSFPLRVFEWKWPAVHMHCPTKRCNCDRTFRSSGFEGVAPTGEIAERPLVLRYVCAACDLPGFFLLECGPAVGEDEPHPLPGPLVNEQPSPTPVKAKHIEWVQKVGQFPQWQAPLDRYTEKALGKQNAALVRKGVACERESFGIAAMAYYRRVLENFIWARLRDDPPTPEDRIEELRKLWRGSEAIELITTKLPDELRPQGTNPLGALYAALSAGIHSDSEEDCADAIHDHRKTLLSLFHALRRCEDSRKTAERMKRLYGTPSEE